MDCGFGTSQVINMIKVDDSKYELSILAVEAENYKYEGRMLFAIALLVHLTLGYGLTLLIGSIYERADVAVSGFEFPSHPSIFPLIKRYEDLRTFDGVSHISLLVNVFSSFLCGLLCGLAVTAQYMRKVYVPGKYVVIGVRNIVRTLFFVVMGIFFFWVYFVFDYRISARDEAGKMVIITWTLLPFFSIANLLFVSAGIPILFVLVLKWKVGAIARCGNA